MKKSIIIISTILIFVISFSLSFYLGFKSEAKPTNDDNQVISQEEKKIDPDSNETKELVSKSITEYLKEDDYKENVTVPTDKISLKCQKDDYYVFYADVDYTEYSPSVSVPDRNYDGILTAMYLKGNTFVHHYSRGWEDSLKLKEDCTFQTIPD